MNPAQLNTILLRRDDGPVLFDEDFRAHITAMEQRIKWLEDELWNALMEVDNLKSTKTALECLKAMAK